MRMSHFTVVLVAWSIPLSAQTPATQTMIQPPVDTAQERQALRKLSMCLAQVRPGWGRQLVAYPYLGSAQANAATEALNGRDRCQDRHESEYTFRTSTLVSAIAEYYLRLDLPKTDSSLVNRELSTMEARNSSEDFALCVASRNPAAARTLALSEPGSSAEYESAEVLRGDIGSCTSRSEKLIVDVQSLRALVTLALYRAVAASRAS